MFNKSKILIIGYGEMGHAMEYLLEQRHEIMLWDKQLNSDSSTNERRVDDLDQALSVVDFVILCIPVNPHKQVLEKIAGNIKTECVCLSIAKGLDEAGNTATDIMTSVLAKNQSYALIYGPMISEEILQGRHAFAQLVCNHQVVYEGVRQLFGGSSLHLTDSTDTNGVNWAVILKNVYAIIIGVADELHLGDNVRGYLMVQSLAEMNIIVQLMKGDKATVYQLAGLGDLVTTSTSDDSHHHELGRRLARGETTDIGGEGVHTIAMVNKYDIFDLTNFPLFKLVAQIINDPAQSADRLQAYINSNRSS